VNTVISFVIVAFAIFLLVRAINRLYRKKEAAPAPPEPTREEVLLTEIRDAIRHRP
jgi:large conductance mechanosensitive channel